MSKRQKMYPPAHCFTIEEKFMDVLYIYAVEWPKDPFHFARGD